MSSPAKKDDSAAENIFQIMDGIIDQLNKTKRMFILMVITIMVVIPVSFAITFALVDSPFPGHRPPWGPPDRPGLEPSGFWLVRTIPFILAIVWLGLGIRQWFVLSKWTKKYEH